MGRPASPLSPDLRWNMRLTAVPNSLPGSWKLHVKGHDRAPVPMPQIVAPVLLPELGRGVIFSLPPASSGDVRQRRRHVASRRCALPLRRRQVMCPCRTGTNRVGLQSAHRGWIEGTAR
jgi:hypothetical protein